MDGDLTERISSASDFIPNSLAAGKNEHFHSIRPESRSVPDRRGVNGPATAPDPRALAQDLREAS